MQHCDLRHNRKVEAKTDISYLGTAHSRNGQQQPSGVGGYIGRAQENATVHADSSDLLENAPYAHRDLDTKMLDKLSISSPGSGLSDAVMLGSGAVAADSNGFSLLSAITRRPVSPSFANRSAISKAKAHYAESAGCGPVDGIDDGRPTRGVRRLIVNPVTKSGLGEGPTGVSRDSGPRNVLVRRRLGFGGSQFGNSSRRRLSEGLPQGSGRLSENVPAASHVPTLACWLKFKCWEEQEFVISASPIAREAGPALEPRCSDGSATPILGRGETRTIVRSYGSGPL